MLNSLLAVLNSREELRRIYGPEAVSVNVSKFPLSTAPFQAGVGEASTTAVASSCE